METNKTGKSILANVIFEMNHAKIYLLKKAVLQKHNLHAMKVLVLEKLKPQLKGNRA